jgi:biotin transport system substrate-specific component
MERMTRRPGPALVAGAFAASFIGGIVVVYSFGILGLMLIAGLSWTQAAVASAAFVPGDLLKCALCAIAVNSVSRGIPGWQQQSDA